MYIIYVGGGWVVGGWGVGGVGGVGGGWGGWGCQYWLDWREGQYIILRAEYFNVCFGSLQLGQLINKDN